MTTPFQQDVQTYHKALTENPSLVSAYTGLIKFMMKIQADFRRTVPDYKAGNISPGYMDITYFSFFDAELREHQLRFGIVFNHQQLQFELWLMGQNAGVQKEYWGKLQHLKWNKDRTEMPVYSVLETVIEAEPDFSDLDRLAAKVIRKALIETKEIREYL